MFKNLEIFNNRMIILYILNTSNSFLSLNQIANCCIDFEDITYFDICDYIDELKRNNYIIENNNGDYSISEEGKNILNELTDLVPGINLYNLKKIINEHMSKIKTEYSIGSTITPINNNEFKISCYIIDGNHEILNISLYSSTKEEAKNISNNFKESAEEIYNNLINKLAADN